MNLDDPNVQKKIIFTLTHVVTFILGAILFLLLRGKGAAPDNVEIAAVTPVAETPLPENTKPSDADDAITGDIESFMDMLEDGLVTSMPLMRSRIDEFNAHWKSKCETNACAKQSQLELLATDPLVTVRRRTQTVMPGSTQTETAVTDFVFEKIEGLRKLGEIEGVSVAIPGDRFIAALPMRESCLGQRASGDPFTVTDIITHQIVFEDRLAADTENLIEFSIVESTNASPPLNQLNLRVVAELPMTPDPSCKAGSRVDRFQRTYTITCAPPPAIGATASGANAANATCRALKTQETKTRECQSPARCD